jgi:hypothetical protein
METVTSSTPVTQVPDPAPPTSPANFSAKKPPRLLYIIGGLAIILVTLALGIGFFTRGTTQSPSENQETSTGAEQNPDFPKYKNITYFYEIGLPKKWMEIKHSPLLNNIALFDADGAATLEITAQKDIRSLDEYLSQQDAASGSGIKATKSSQVKVGTYDGIERSESWSAVGLQAITTYIKVQDMLYTFALIPTASKNAITNEATIREYRAALASFRLTDTSQLGQDLKEYQSAKVAGLAFKAFSLKYPQTWVATETLAENSLDVSVYRNNYELTISQKAVGGAVCLFSDSPAFEGSSGDLRNKQFAEFNTESGAILRRYFNANAGDKSTMFFCEKQTDGPYFQTPLSIGGLVYNVPAKYDPDIIKEMDDIVKSIKVVDDQAQ